MSDNDRDAGLFLVVFVAFDFLFRVRFAGPLARRFGKNLNSITSDRFTEEQRFIHAAGNGHVGAENRATRRFALRARRRASHGAICLFSTSGSVLMPDVTNLA